MSSRPGSRDVSWGVLRNARDLGGLPTSSGTETRRGAIYRSGRLDPLDAEGWAALIGDGVRTVVDLRSPREITPLPARPPSLTVIAAPLEDESDEAFFADWQRRAGGPGVYLEALEHWPSQLVAALSAIADAPDAGLVVHCSAGRDRTGLVCALLLTEAGVSRADVLDDYEAGVRGMNESLVGQQDPPERLRDEVELAAAIAASRAELDTFLDDVDVPAVLSAGGGSGDLLARASARLG